ncbi:hypothetical protein HDU77_001951 [Chytriomyces hyalinus]|nr:hypothetical protein HDU77_001951 [Chytriomyces hyalinus]
MTETAVSLVEDARQEARLATLVEERLRSSIEHTGASVLIALPPPSNKSADIVDPETQTALSFVSFLASDLIDGVLPTVDSARAIVDVVSFDRLEQVADTLAHSFVAEGVVPSPASKALVFVLGGPGSGKGTQSELLARDFQLAHLSAGDLLRAEVQSGSEVGRMAEAIMKDGKIVPMDVILSLLQKAIVETPPHYRGILIDGFPRALDQAKRFEETIARASLVINFTVPLPVLEQRLLDRGKTSGRVDDNLESIRKRFSTHVQESGPVLEYFGDRVLNVDGSASVEEVYDVVGEAVLEAEIFEPDVRVVFAMGAASQSDEARELCMRLADSLNLDFLELGDADQDEILEAENQETLETEGDEGNPEFSEQGAASQPADNVAALDSDLVDRLYDIVAAHVRENPGVGLLIETVMEWSPLFEKSSGAENHVLSLFTYAADKFLDPDAGLPDAIQVVEVVTFEPFEQVFERVHRELCEDVQDSPWGNVIFAISDGSLPVESQLLCSRVAEAFELSVIQFGENIAPRGVETRKVAVLEKVSVMETLEEEHEEEETEAVGLGISDSIAGNAVVPRAIPGDFEDVEADLVAEYVTSQEEALPAKTDAAHDIILTNASQIAKELSSSLAEIASAADAQSLATESTATKIQQLDTELAETKSDITRVSEGVAANVAALLDQRSQFLTQREADATAFRDMEMQVQSLQEEVSLLREERKAALKRADEAAAELLALQLEHSQAVRAVESDLTEQIQTVSYKHLDALNDASQLRTLLANNEKAQQQQSLDHSREIESYVLTHGLLETQVLVLEESLTEARDAYSRLSASHASLEESHATLLAVHETQSKEFEAHSYASSKSIAALQAELLQTQLERQQVLEALQESEDELKAAHERIHDLGSVLGVMKGHVARLVEQQQQQQRAGGGGGAKVAVLEEHVGKLEKTIGGLKAEVQFLKSLLK